MRSAHRVAARCLRRPTLALHLQGARHLVQQEMVCVLFVPFRPADYTYVSTLADVRRRESFATARARAQAITQAALPDTLWNFETLDGSPYDAADALSLAAFPDMDNRTEDLYTTYLIAALMAATGVDLNDIIGKSSKMPYYYAHQLCSGAACSSFTLGELASIQAQTSGARGTISCATEPTELALPFTQSAHRPMTQRRARTCASACVYAPVTSLLVTCTHVRSQRMPTAPSHAPVPSL